jgi:hypothetical protein
MSTRRLNQSRIASKKFKPAGLWVRNPSWPTLTEPAATDQKLVGLYAVFEDVGDSNVASINFNDTYTIDWGDGTSDVSVINNQEHVYSFSNANLYDATVTLTDSTDTITRNNHGYSNTDKMRFYRIQTTTGLAEGRLYYVINATQNTFQVSENVGGSAVTLTNDGSASLLPYKIATIVAEADAGSTVTRIELNRKLGIFNYDSVTNWLDLVVAAPNCTNYNQTNNVNLPRLMERLKIISLANTVTDLAILVDAHNVRECEIPLFTYTGTSLQNRHRQCFNLRVGPYYDTSSVTDFRTWFSNCNSLERIPRYNTSSATLTDSMFQNCSSLKTIPQMDFQNVTSMSSMFNGCFALEKLPEFNMSSCTNAAALFANCLNLREVPALDVSSVTNALAMFSSCNSLQYLPPLDFSSATTLQSAFQSCISLRAVTITTSSALTNCNNMFNNCVLMTHPPVFDTSAVTNISGMFRNCSSLTEIPDFDFSSVTTVDGTTFTSNRSLRRIRMTGLGVSFSVANCSLSSDALNEIYTNLPTVTSKTITVSGNYGVSGDDPTIATAKGWTVSG